MSRSDRKVTSFKELISRLEHEGWKVEQKKSGHFRMTSPKGAVVFTSGTASDYRAIRNIERDLKRAGWQPRSL